jgi:hypothetical protein
MLVLVLKNCFPIYLAFFYLKITTIDKKLLFLQNFLPKLG